MLNTGLCIFPRTVVAKEKMHHKSSFLNQDTLQQERDPIENELVILSTTGLG